MRPKTVNSFYLTKLLRIDRQHYELIPKMNCFAPMFEQISWGSSWLFSFFFFLCKDTGRQQTLIVRWMKFNFDSILWERARMHQKWFCSVGHSHHSFFILRQTWKYGAKDIAVAILWWLGLLNASRSNIKEARPLNYSVEGRLIHMEWCNYC